MKRCLCGMVAVLMLAVTGCAPPVAKAPETVNQPQKPSPEQEFSMLAGRMAQLPGAELLETASQQGVGYPEGVLFTRDSVLPLPGGSALLDPLVTLLKEFPEQHWQLLLAAETDHGPDYDKRLAQQRQILVRRYLQKRGVELDRIDFKVDSSGGMPLRLIAVPENHESSSAVLNE